MTDGRIITFYSFKGGVGRTMALANIAYLAASNGKRVLIMDWDLEAPGLAYYFRGFVNAEQGNEIRRAPGVLNVLWDWNQRATSSTPQELAAMIDRYKNGQAFERCVRPIMEADFLPPAATLDFIGTGSQSIDEQNPQAYEQALSDFSWHHFFHAASGGIVIDAWRRWAKRNYDLVLVDSRTGFADAAGVCTMQLPDEVALCFILNRQNIDGTANVSAAIRANGSERIRLRAVPMRTSRSNTSEESDAKARTLTELTSVGGFSQEEAQRDIEELSVSAADNVPFYETLSPFAASSPSLDLLAFNYRRLAKNLLNEDIREPEISPELHQRVRQRLQPRFVTAEYLNELAIGDPARHFPDLSPLLDSALADEESGIFLPDEYSQQLIETATNRRMGFDDRNVLQTKALDYLRKLYERSEERWQNLMIQSLDAMILFATSARFLLTEDDCALFEELDHILSTSVSFKHRFKRIKCKTQLAEHYLRTMQLDKCRITTQQTRALMGVLRNFSSTLADSESAELSLADYTIMLLEGALLEHDDLSEQAALVYTQILEKVESEPESADWWPLRRCSMECYFRLAVGASGTPGIRAQYAIAAVEMPDSLLGFASRFIQLGQAVFNAHDPELLNRFLSISFEKLSPTRLGIGQYLAQSSTNRQPFLRWLVIVLAATEPTFALTSSNAENLADAALSMIEVETGRYKSGSSERGSELLELSTQITDLFQRQPIQDSTRVNLKVAVAALQQRLISERGL